jgi:hypothetical protein
MTSEVLVHKPIFLGEDCMIQDKEILEQKKAPRKRGAF